MVITSRACACLPRSRLDILDGAEFLLESVLVFAPDYNAARYEYASVLSKRHKHQQALEQIRKL
jgi:hypothetical protein